MQSAVPVPVGSRLQEIAKIQNYIAPAWLNRPACILGTSIYPSKEEVWAQQPFGLCPLGCVTNITTQKALTAPQKQNDSQLLWNQVWK